jgi:hypothetical protein
VPISNASIRLRTRVAKAASIARLLSASATPISIPMPEAATVTSFVTAADGELLGLTSSPIRLAAFRDGPKQEGYHQYPDAAPELGSSFDLAMISAPSRISKCSFG